MYMKTFISIPNPLFHAAERLAHRMHFSRSQLYQAAIEQFIKEYVGRDATGCLDPVYGKGGVSKPPIPNDVARMQGATLDRGEW
jgi:hypothetical protein